MTQTSYKTLSITALKFIVIMLIHPGASAAPTVFEVGPEGSDAAILLKHDAQIDDLRPEMAPVGPAIQKAFLLARIQERPVITSGSEFLSWRTPWSLHLKGLAVDVRGKHYSRAKLEEIVVHLQSLLGSDFDIVLEWHAAFHPYNHLHIEWDPENSG